MNIDPERGNSETYDVFIPAKLQIGKLYWNGSEWTDTDTTFKITVDVGNNRYIYLRDYIDKWLDFKNSVPWGSNISHKGILIPLPDGLIDGQPKLTIYKPYNFRVNNTTYTYKPYFAAIKDLKLEVVVDVADTDSDTEYTNVINTNYASELDKIEFKINTYTGKSLLIVLQLIKKEMTMYIQTQSIIRLLGSIRQVLKGLTVLTHSMVNLIQKNSLFGRFRTSMKHLLLNWISTLEMILRCMAYIVIPL